MVRLFFDDLFDLNDDFFESSDVIELGIEAPPVPALGRFETENDDAERFVGVGEEARLLFPFPFPFPKARELDEGWEGGRIGLCPMGGMLAAGLTRSLDTEAMAAAIPPEGLDFLEEEEVEKRRFEGLGASREVEVEERRRP